MRVRDERTLAHSRSQEEVEKRGDRERHRRFKRRGGLSQWACDVKIRLEVQVID